MHPHSITYQISQIGLCFSQAVQDLHVMPAFCWHFGMSMQETNSVIAADNTLCGARDMVHRWRGVLHRHAMTCFTILLQMRCIYGGNVCSHKCEHV